SIAVPLLRARIPGGPLRNADIACGNPERTVGAWRQHPTTVAGLYACATHGEPYLHRSRRQQGGLRATGGRRHLYRRQHYPGDLPLEFRHAFQADHALVPGRGGRHIHHPQVSTGCAGTARDAGRHFGVELLAARRSGRALVHPLKPVGRYRCERGAYFLVFTRRQEPRRERQHPGSSGLHILAMSPLSKLEGLPGKGAVVECVPNFSEGVDAARIEAILAAMCVEGVHLLDWTMDEDHNRSIVTIAGEPAAVVE